MNDNTLPRHSSGGHMRWIRRGLLPFLGLLLFGKSENSDAGFVQLGFNTTSATYVAEPLPMGFFGQINGVDSDPFPGGPIPFMSGPVKAYLPIQAIVGFVLTGPGAHAGTTVGHQHTWLNPVYGEVLSPFDTIVKYNTFDIQYGPGKYFNNYNDIAAEIVHLSLQSLDHLNVNYGTAGVASFDAFISLDPTKHSTGTLELTQQVNQGTASVNFTLHGLLTFKQVSGPTPIGGEWQTPIDFKIGNFVTPAINPEAISYGTFIIYSDGDSAFALIPEPGSLTLLGLGFGGFFVMNRVGGSHRRKS